MNTETITINYIGQDYSPLNDAAKKATAFIADKELSTESKKKILIKYLASVKTSDLIVNKSKDNKNNVKKLYSPDFNEGYFAGLAGVLQGQLDLKGSDFLHESDASDLNIEDTYHFKIKVQIQSRLDKKYPSTEGKPYFLSTLLLRDSIKLNDHTVPNSEDELYDYLLLFWFKEQLLNAYLKGYFRTYRRFEKNDDRLKGNIDIARHIRMNMGQNNGKIAYSYRENTIDNYLNHMIVASYQHLKKKYYDLVIENFDNNSTLKTMIDHLKTEIGYSDYSSHTLISKNIKPISHPYYIEYEELRKTCMKILRDEGISIFDGEESIETKGILVYIPDLWEKFLEDHIRKSIPDQEIELYAQKNLSVFEHHKKYSQNTIPDYVFENKENGIKFLILDAKFKPKWESIFDIKTHSSPISDVLGDYDKCLRDMVTINAAATGTVFPTNISTPVTKEILCHKISEQNQIHRFYTLPICIPYSEDFSYSSWKTMLTENIDHSMQILNNFVIKEKEYSNKILPYITEMQKLQEEMDFDIPYKKYL